MPTTETQWTTLAFMIAVTAVIVAYDVWTVNTHGSSSSISRVTLGLLEAFPVLLVVGAFAMGVLVGHLALPQAR